MKMREPVPAVNNRVLLGMSGGVDSTAAALLLKEKGYEVVGVTYRLVDSPTSEANIEDAKRAASKIGIEHVTVDYRDAFSESVINDFIQEYGVGRTPNPCVVCNKHIKYGQFLSLIHI